MLNLISTPIGNLDDISLRAIDVIKSSDYIYAEDTRSFKKILKHIKCEKICKSFHEHNEEKISKEIIKLLKNGKNIVLACEAGTPAISDPGYKLIREINNLNIRYTLLPGPSAVINALVISGLPTDKFSFYGFIPRKVNAKEELFKKIAIENKTSICFESIKRLEDSLKTLSKFIDTERKISVCREMTKAHEQIVTDNCKNVLKEIYKGNIPLKGEVVLIVEGESNKKFNVKIDNKIKQQFLSKMSTSEAAKLISLLTKQNKREIYKFLKES